MFIFSCICFYAILTSAREIRFRYSSLKVLIFFLLKLIHHVVKSSSMDFNDWESNSVGYWFCFLSLWGLLISSDTSTKVDITTMHQTLSSQKCQLSGYILPLLDIMSVTFSRTNKLFSTGYLFNLCKTWTSNINNFQWQNMKNF